MYDYITIKGARLNNLKNISLSIPKNKLVVLTGLSGSGKSSLAFDTLQKECQRQYMESMGMVTDYISKPKIDAIEGLSPSISVDQRITNKSPRSTVGTVTEVFTYLRILFAKLGTRNCPGCGRIIEPTFKLNGNNDIDFWDGDTRGSAPAETDETYGTAFACGNCKTPIPELTMSHFSFNKPIGACPTCTGLGTIYKANLHLLVDENKSIVEGAVLGWDIHYIKRYSNTLRVCGNHYGFEFDPEIPVKKFGNIQKDLLFYGIYSWEFKRHFPGIQPPETASKGRFEGVATNLLRRYSERVHDINYREKMENFLVKRTCPDCKGTRLKKEIRDVKVNDRTIIELSKMSLIDLHQWIVELPHSIPGEGLTVMEPIIADIKERVKRLIDVGVGYLSMERGAPTLSAGEAQRLRLASLLGSGLTGVLYVLDEPTVGLHSRDTHRLIHVLKKLRDLGNTVIVIEHDIDMIKAADFIIDIGPGAGRNGGEVVVTGSLEQVAACDKSFTGKWLSGKEHVEIPTRRRPGNGNFLTIHGARENNLKNITVNIPLGKIIAFSGVSGSGKSSLLFNILDRAARQRFHNATQIPGEYKEITGWEYIDKIITIDQTPIGKTPRSNAATYTDVFTPIRMLYSKLPEARTLKLQAKHFSFNVPGGRCERCQGAGVLTIGMHFLPEVEVRCPSCHGRRFKKEILDVKYSGNHISDILDMSIRDALQLFVQEKSIADKLGLMDEVGLGYLHLGQPATTLSGGEAQRIKLAKELSKRGTGNTLYLLDEPTTGLHPHDVSKLIRLIRRLVDEGNTVVVIEHNIDIITSADWVIDLGPEGGDAGGEIIARGTPEEVAKMNNSITGTYLRKIFT
jgi:excinuclease ABC subunit A